MLRKTGYQASGRILHRRMRIKLFLTLVKSIKRYSHYLWEFLYIVFLGLWSNVYIVQVPSFIDYIPGQIRALLAFAIYRGFIQTRPQL